jgi:hypothetical protein
MRRTRGMPRSGIPSRMILWSVASDSTTNYSSVLFGPPTSTVDGIDVRAWQKYTVEVTAPAGTDHMAVCLCGLSIGGEAEAVRFDSVTLKQIL